MISDDELLTAYLTGELPDADASALEERLQSDGQLATRLDRLADALVVLQGLDDVALPDGFSERLSRRLEAESTVTDLREVRERRARRWYAVGTAAAVLAAVTVVSVGIVPRGGSDATQESDGPVALEAPQEAGGGQEAQTESAAGTDMAADEDTQTDDGTSAAPQAMRAEVDLADEDAVGDHFADVAAIDALLGQPTDGDDAARLADQAAADLPCGHVVPPDAVVAAADLVQYAGQPAVAYAFVTASDDVFDAARAIVVTRDESCDTLALVTLR